MKITIQDCFKLPSFANSKVLSGQGSLDRQISHLTILGENSPEDIEKKNDYKEILVATSFFGIKDNVERQMELIKKLASCNAEVIVLYKLETVDRRIVELCQKLRIVLIVIANSQSLRTNSLIEEVSHLLFYGRDDGFKKAFLTDVAFHLMNFEQYDNFESALRVAAIENEFQFVLMNGDLSPVLIIETKYEATVEEAVALARDMPISRKGAVYTSLDVNGVLTYWGPLNLSGEQYYIFIVDNKDIYSKDEIIKLANVIAMAMGMWKYTPKKDIIGEFIKALRRGNTSLAHSIREENNIKENLVSVYLYRGILDYQLRDEFSRLCNDNNLDLYRSIEGRDTFGVLTGDADVATMTRIYNAIKGNKEDKLFHITGLNNIEDASEGFKLIEASWQSATKIFPYKRMFSKYDLAIVNGCIHVMEMGGSYKRSYLKLIESFHKTGSIKEKELLKTLETFVLDANMNSLKTAEVMNVHSNTIQYRLKRISEILGIEITANRVLPAITMALALNRLEN